MENQENKLNHLSIILDGNRRYAKQKGKEPWKGHDAGAETFEKFLNWCKELNIKEITAYILSTENLKREPKELEHLFSLFKKWFEKFSNSKEIHDNKVKIRFIGDLNLVPEEIRKSAEELQEKTKGYDNYILNLCFAYGGRTELVNAVNKLLKQEKKQITEKDIQENLWLKTEPDLIIRTGNVKRTSNFLPWQSTYSEWIFIEKMWPEFTKQDLLNCIEEFKSRKKNFGK
jgi:tritrans,polycis-undecaprenyl-diphosphate synthase [geranylgeranyl-diphosphate specific]